MFFLFLILSSLSSLLSPAPYGARLISHLCCQFYFGDRDQGPHMAWQGPSGLLQQPPGRVSVTVLVKRCWWWWWSEMSSGSDDLQVDPHRQLFRQLLDGDFICSCRRLFGMRCKRISIFEGKASGQTAQRVSSKRGRGRGGRETKHSESDKKPIWRQRMGMDWKTENWGIWRLLWSRCRLRSTQLTKR